MTPDQAAESELVVKRSRFLARACHVESLEAAREELRHLQELYPDATHIVHACLCGPKGDNFSCSDANEPPGTAGRPILEVLKGSGLSDVLVTVTRWFGGTKLGTGGLARAYADAARQVLEKLPRRRLEQRHGFSLYLPYTHYEQAVRLLLAAGGEINHTDFGAAIHLRGLIGAEAGQHLQEKLSELLAQKVELNYVK